MYHHRLCNHGKKNKLFALWKASSFGLYKEYANIIEDKMTDRRTTTRMTTTRTPMIRHILSRNLFKNLLALAVNFWVINHFGGQL